MIEIEAIKKLAVKHQTREENIIREYLQHFFLSVFYKQKESRGILFKGGTALRIIYGSPRFSEDLDFSFSLALKKQVIENAFLETVSKISESGIEINIKDSKITSGGYLGEIFYNLYGFKGCILFEVSSRKIKRNLSQETTTIVSEFFPPYIIEHLAASKIVEEKILALLERKKPRDFYDLYFILRHPLLRTYVPRNKIEELNKLVIKGKVNFARELKTFLPLSHQSILKNFKKNLLKELAGI